MAELSLHQIARDIEADLKRKMNEKTFRKVEEAALKQMDFVKNESTERGTSPAEGGRWNNVYNKEYARREKGGRRSPVTLRNNRRRIEDTRIEREDHSSVMRFQDRRGGEIFFYHHSGTARGGKYRQVYPNSDQEVPASVDEAAERKLTELLRE